MLRNLKDVLTSLHFFNGEAKDGWLGNEHGPGSLARFLAHPSPNAYGSVLTIVKEMDAVAQRLYGAGRVHIVYFEALKQRLQNFSGRSLIVAESPGRREAVRDWLQPLGLKARDYKDWADFCSDSRRLGMVVGPIQDGLQLGEQIQIIAEPQIFGLRAQVSRRRKPVRDPDTILRDLDALSIGSPVVHVEHGVGRYAGLKILDAGGFTEEYLVIEYAGQDKLYVPVASLRQVHRYTGAESETAPLHAMGSERWRKARAKAREKARDVAAELLQIQARRAARVGQAMPLNELDYRRFCEGFAFETTPDQQQAIDQVLADLAGTQPMDRVVCGDVGFGKTEVALRASFAAAQNGFQVCLLAPTTLLAQQHYKNFCDRFADWPIKIGVASRLRTGKELNALVRELESGNVDIVIGTHRLLQDDVRFKQLGLVIVDEEHRFGVRHKERMKKLRAEVDLLTLTATPIPRTLNMSMAGLRDLSIIATPPPLRLAIRTFVFSIRRLRAACAEAGGGFSPGPSPGAREESPHPGEEVREEEEVL